MIKQQEKPAGFIQEYLDGESWLIKENANSKKAYSHLKGYIADRTMEEYVLSKYPSDIRRLHEKASIHIHDLRNGITGYCHGADFIKLLTEGLWTPRIVSGPPKHLSSALDQLVNFFCTSQNEWAGAQAVGDFNTCLAPFVAADNLSYDQVVQAFQQFVFNLNYPSRSSNEAPFTNVMINTKCPDHLADLPVFPQLKMDATFSDFHDESLTILRAFNEVISRGDAEGNPHSFPIPTISLIPSTNFDNPIWLEIMETEAKYGLYYMYNFIGSGIKPETKRAMCCRVSISLEKQMDAGGRWAYGASTGSVGVATLNLAQLGFLAHDEASLFERLDYLLEKTKQSLMMKDKWCRTLLDNGYLQLTKHYGVDFDRYFRTIGLIGLPELTRNFSETPIWDSIPFVQKIMNHIREKTKEFQLETGSMWNIELTPGEGSATRLAMVDRKQYPDIHTKGTSDAPYYSSLVTPPSAPMSVTERLNVEEKILPLFTGGTVHRIFLGERNPSPVGLKKLMLSIANQSKVSYFDFAATYSICKKCGEFTQGAYYNCPACGGETKVFSRIVGYYRNLRDANVGKVQEFEDRLYTDVTA